MGVHLMGLHLMGVYLITLFWGCTVTGDIAGSCLQGCGRCGSAALSAYKYVARTGRLPSLPAQPIRHVNYARASQSPMGRILISKPNKFSAELISKLGIYLKQRVSKRSYILVDSIAKYIRKSGSKAVGWAGSIGKQTIQNLIVAG